MTHWEICLKYSNYTFIALFWVCGTLSIVLGSVWLSEDSDEDLEYINHLPSVYKTAAAIFLILFGFIILLVAALGCCAVFFEKPDLLIVFVICVLILFIIELGFGIHCAAVASKVESSVELNVKNYFYSNSKTPKSIKAFKQIEKKMKCCGLKSYQDYFKIQNPVPESCCSDQNDCKNKPNSYWQDGCLSKIREKTIGQNDVGISVSFFSALFLAAGSILGLALTIIMFKKRHEG